MKNSNLKYLGMALIVLGALMAIVATFILNNLLDQKFNWYISLCLIFVIGGLIAHIMFNKYLPLEDEDGDEEVEPVKMEPINEVPVKDIKKEEVTKVVKEVKEEVKVDVKKAAKEVEDEATKVVKK